MQAEPDIRELTLDHDFEAVSELYERCADYLTLEQGRPPDDNLAREFFTDGPPGGHPIERIMKRGLFSGGQLVALGDLILEYPTSTAAFIGLLLLDPAVRGSGLGVTFLRYLEDQARMHGASSLYLAVLDENPRARAFWEREGFSHHETVQRRIGARDHVLHRMVRSI